jgi:hypothetical protein
MIKELVGHHWRIRSVQRFGYMIERLDNPADVRSISIAGWNEAPIVEDKK